MEAAVRGGLRSATVAAPRARGGRKSSVNYDLVVVGSGPAGEKAAALAAYFGKRVAVIERDDRLGGAPVNRGGIPTKTLRETALYLTSFRRQEVYGLGLRLSPDFVLERLRVRAEQVSATAGEAVRRNFERHGIDVIPGVASVGEDRTVTVVESTGGQRTIKASVIIVATGSRPFRPPNIHFDDPDVYDSDTILDLDSLPRSLVVIGGGPVGSEFASVFDSLGVEVTIIDGADRLLPQLDGEVSGLIQAAFKERGIHVLVASPGARVERDAESVKLTLTDGQVLRPHKVLFAAGRVGNTQGLGLKEAGIELDERNRIVVDQNFQTTAQGIYAAGDVIGPPALASVSAEQGRVAACHAFNVPFDLSVDWLPPMAVYTMPEVGAVGMTEEAAAREGVSFVVGRSWFADNARSLIAGTTQGMIKLVLDKNDRKLLGVHIVGEDAAELVHVGQAVMHNGGSVDQFLHGTFNIPTRSEVYKYAAYDALQNISGHFLPALNDSGRGV
jgi:NAD(P) transhydrogenase